MRLQTKVVAISAAAIIGGAGLVGCSSAGGSDAHSCVGDWGLVSMSANGQSVGTEELVQLEEMGLTISLSAQEDGNATFVFLGEEETGTWVESSTGCTFDFSGAALNAVVSDGQLVLEEEGQVVTFEKMVD